jgi:tyrosine-protein kinase Etk/Wzc
MSQNTPPRIDLAFLRERTAQKRLVAGVLAGAVFGLLYFLIAPSWYQSVLTVVPVKAQAGGGLSALLGGDMGGLAATLAGGGGATADAARIAAVLQSVAVTDAVVDKFSLQDRYKASHREVARDRLWQHCNVKTLPKPNLVQLTCEDKDPAFVQRMLTYFAEYGNEVFRRVSVSSATEEVRYLERRIADLRRQADESAVRMREFQEQHKIVDLDSQARALVTSVAAVNAQRISKQMELDYARSFTARDEATARQLASQLSVMEDALRDLEVPREDPTEPPAKTGAGKGGSKGLFPAAMAVPRLRAEYEKLYRDRKVAEATLVFGLDRLESARASEARDVSTFQVLDPPALPTKRSRPRGSESVALGALLGLAVATVFAGWKARRS